VWDWAERPAGVVTLPSRSRPRLITALGQRIAAAGKLSYLGGLEYRNGAPPGRQYNSAQRLAALWRTLAVPGDLRSALDGFGGPVLLVDDRIGTGWTMTVGAKLLRECDAPAVLPFALAVNT
jgi:ATP-dependent DNA helicase RecQ